MLNYPLTAQGADADDDHGERVADPYRWLETPGAEETAAWIAAQNELTQGWLAQSGDREALRELLTELSDYPRRGVPFERGGRWFQFRNPGLANQPVLHVMDAPRAEGRVLLDPNLLSPDGTVAVSGAEVSEDGALLAYATSSGGSDWQTWRVRFVETGVDLPDLIEWAKFTGAAWRADGSGFYYGAPDRPDEGSEHLAADGLHRIFFHRIGAPQAKDELVYEPDQPGWMPHARVSEDGRFLIISISEGTRTETALHVLDLTEPGATMVALVGDFTSSADVVTTAGSTFFLVTDYQAERKRLVTVDLARPGREHWTEIIAQAPDTLVEARCFGGKLVCHYLRDAHSVLRVFGLDGTPHGEIALPGIASIGDACGGDDGGLSGRAASALMHFGVMSFTESGAVWSHDLATGVSKEIFPSAARIDPGQFVTEQVFVRSADGTMVPVFLTRSAGLRPAGDVPALLYGYGGFDVPVTPTFSVLHAAWLRAGGLLAVGNLRGGGEYGKAWHDGGRLAVKQNVFDDFCACARWLADSGWSRPGRIAITGGSNGGLLVGACLVQHPELFGACVPRVGVLDMLRFHKFTIGWAWKSDYGDPDDPEQYRWLRAYSPLHNLRPGERYPATLLTTGDHDDRVVPGHSFKFAAALQSAQAGDEPVLIRVETSAGHGAGKPTGKIIAESADILAFLRLALRISGPLP